MDFTCSHAYFTYHCETCFNIPLVKILISFGAYLKVCRIKCIQRHLIHDSTIYECKHSEFYVIANTDLSLEQ